MKTKLLKKWRREAFNRIGVFIADDETYTIVFDKSAWGFVYEYANCPSSSSFQIVCAGIKDFHEAVERCDDIRRVYILREARNEWNKKKYGTKKRFY